MEPLDVFRRLAKKIRGAIEHAKEDVEAVLENDPAATSRLEVVLVSPGLHALWLHRAAHELWSHDRRLASRLLSHVNRFMTGVEVHPGAHVGRKVVIDHGMGIVIGETATIGDRCILYKGVVLGGVSLSRTLRHPQIGKGVVIGSNACILGAISVGDGARIGSGSVVVRPVPPGSTVVGVPARAARRKLSGALDHASLSDPVADWVRIVEKQNEILSERLTNIESALGVHVPRSMGVPSEEPPSVGG